jgi:RNA polymerase sigma-70 factor (ECF subfamily)
MLIFLMAIENEEARSKLEEIYRIYYRDMYITAYSILKDYHESEDIIQNAILRIYNNLHKISDVQSKKTRAYLVIIVRNLCYNVFNKRKGIVLLEHEEIKRFPDMNESPIEEHLIKMDMSYEIAKHLEQIHPPYADILMLRFYYQLEISEISELLDITPNNVSVRLNRAIAVLKNILEEEGDIYEQSI